MSRVGELVSVPPQLVKIGRGRCFCRMNGKCDGRSKSFVHSAPRRIVPAGRVDPSAWLIRPPLPSSRRQPADNRFEHHKEAEGVEGKEATSSHPALGLARYSPPPRAAPDDARSRYCAAACPRSLLLKTPTERNSLPPEVAPSQSKLPVPTVEGRSRVLLSRLAAACASVYVREQ